MADKPLEYLTLNDELYISQLLSEHLSIIEHLPLIREEYWKRREAIDKYQRSLSKYCDDSEG